MSGPVERRNIETNETLHKIECLKVLQNLKYKSIYKKLCHQLQNKLIVHNKPKRVSNSNFMPHARTWKNKKVLKIYFCAEKIEFLTQKQKIIFFEPFFV